MAALEAFGKNDLVSCISLVPPCKTVETGAQLYVYFQLRDCCRHGHVLVRAVWLNLTRFPHLVERGNIPSGRGDGEASSEFTIPLGTPVVVSRPIVS